VASLNKFQFGAIAGAVGLIVLLYFAPKKGDTDPKKEKETSESGFSMEAYMDSLKSTLPAAEGQSLVNREQLLEQARNPEQKVSALDSLSKQWNTNRQVAVAGYYMEQKALLSGKALDWTNAGNKYYGASKFGNEALKPMWMDKAIECYGKVVELEPNNLDAKVSLGVCYVEGTRDPMKGIGLLREVVQRDSTNINAQLNLGMFAVQSGQYDKAIDRFNKILVMHPDYIEAYLYLGQTYAAKGEKGRAIEILEKYKGLNKDETINAEVQGYINELKNS
jgi:tetratricopeptide (TPR) repeat protein